MTKYDPSKLFVGARLFKDSNEAGSPIIDENTKEWQSGKVVIQLFDSKTGLGVASKELKVTRNKYLVWREDFDPLSTEEVIKEYFDDVELDVPTKTALQVEAEKSAADTAAKEKDVRIAELEAQLKARDTIEAEFDPLTPPAEEPKPEKETIAKK